MTKPVETDTIGVMSNTGPLMSAFQCGWTDRLDRYCSVIYITASELAEFDKHGWTEEIHRLMDDGLVAVVEPLTEQEKEEAEWVAKRIAAHPTSGDPDWPNHLPEAEAMVMMHQRTHLMFEQILLDEKAARHVAQEQGLGLTGFPGVLTTRGTGQLAHPG